MSSPPPISSLRNGSGGMASLRIQRAYRGWRGRQAFLVKMRQIWAAHVIQRAWRGYAGRGFFTLLKTMHAASAQLQRCARGRRWRLAPEGGGDEGGDEARTRPLASATRANSDSRLTLEKMNHRRPARAGGRFRLLLERDPPTRIRATARVRGDGRGGTVAYRLARTTAVDAKTEMYVGVRTHCNLSPSLRSSFSSP